MTLVENKNGTVTPMRILISGAWAVRDSADA